MNLTFRLRFATRVGQSLWLAGDKPFPGQMPLQYRDRESWELKISLPAAQKAAELFLYFA